MISSSNKKPQSKRKVDYETMLPLTVQPNMNETSNVLMQYTLTDLAQRAQTNFWLGLICLGVCAINIVLLYLNWVMNRPEDEASSSLHPNVSERTFHLMEFWTSHIYAITEAFALVTSPKTMLNIYSKPTILKLLLFFNVVSSLVPALLITLDTEYFEKLAHELEFINEFTLSFITLILLVSLVKRPDDDTDTDTDNTATTSALSSSSSSSTTATNNASSSVVMGVLACAMAATTFGVYNLYKEETAHYLEFSFNLGTSLITFWFCLDNRFVAQMEIGQILYGQHQNCNFCQKRTSEFRKQATSVRWRSLYGGDVGQKGEQEGELASLLLADEEVKLALSRDEKQPLPKFDFGVKRPCCYWFTKERVIL